MECNHFYHIRARVMFAHRVGRAHTHTRYARAIVVCVRYLNANDVMRQLRSITEFLVPNIQDNSIPTRINHKRASAPLITLAAPRVNYCTCDTHSAAAIFLHCMMIRLIISVHGHCVGLASAHPNYCTTTKFMQVMRIPSRIHWSLPSFLRALIVFSIS